MHQRIRRLAALEALYRTQEEGVLHVWRLPEEAVEEAFDRYEVDPDDFPHVRVYVWLGGQAAARLTTPPAPCWVSQTQPVMTDLEHRLHEGMQQRILPL